jgi:uncharacterized protein (TIGR02118 family)
MYCLTVTYPKSEGSSFDLDYYRDKHVPLCARLFADHGFRGAVLRSAEGRGPGSADLNHASVDLLFDSQEQLQAALAAGGQEVSADVVNYTDVKPRMSFGEVSLELS